MMPKTAAATPAQPELALDIPHAPRPAKQQKPRWSIGQWFGTPIERMSEAERKAAAAKGLAKDSNKSMACPAHAASAPGWKCNKVGGVCCVRKTGEDGSFPDGEQATVCPVRFLEGNAVLSEIARTIIKPRSGSVVLVPELPFLKGVQADGDEEEGGERATGKIDWICVDPADQSNWCAVEFQSVYISGKSISAEYEIYQDDHDGVLFPAENHRPDYRSSGPKRLAPQLKIKAGLLTKWSRKTAVVIDAYFLRNMGEMKEVGRPGMSEDDRVSMAEIVWFVVDYDANGQLFVVKKICTDIATALNALDAAEEMTKKEFQERLIEAVGKGKGATIQCGCAPSFTQPERTLPLSP